MLYIYVFFLHFVGDFILQSDEISKTKSKSIKALTIHICILTATLFIGMLLTIFICEFSLKNVILFVLINGVLHFAIDFVTSKVTSYFYSKGQTHNFFVTIGFDQFLHLACYVLSIDCLLR